METLDPRDRITTYVDENGMTVHRLPTRPSRYKDDRPSRRDIEAILSIGDRRYGFGYISAEGLTRYVEGGPMLPGPHAWANIEASVITANPEHSSGAESRRMRAAGTEVVAEWHDFVEIDGTLWELHPDHNGNIKLRRADVDRSLDSLQVGDIVSTGYRYAIRVHEILPERDDYNCAVVMGTRMWGEYDAEAQRSVNRESEEPERVPLLAPWTIAYRPHPVRL